MSIDLAALAIKLAVGASPDDQRTGYVHNSGSPTDEVAAECHRVDGGGGLNIVLGG